MAQSPFDFKALPSGRKRFDARHIRTQIHQALAELFTMLREEVRMHPMEEAFFSEVVINVLARLHHLTATHGIRQGDLFDGVDFEAIAGPFIDQADRLFEQRRITTGHATQTTVVEFETVVRRHSVAA